MTATAVVVAYGVDRLDLAWVPKDVLVVVVHNDDQLPDTGCDHPRVRHVHPGTNLGFGAGVNLALRQVRTDRVIICNPDVALQHVHWQALAEGAEHDIVTVPLVDPSGTPARVVVPYPTPVGVLSTFSGAVGLMPRGSKRRQLALAVMGDRAAAHRWSQVTTPGRYPLTDHWVSGAVISVPTALMAAVGGFDESYFLYFEDIDLSQRLARADPAAKIVVAATPPAVHLGGGSSGAPDDQRRATEHRWRSGALYARRQHGAAWTLVRLVLPLLRPHRIAPGQAALARFRSAAVVDTEASRDR
jgi:GT2 family glycosyltransferase